MADQPTILGSAAPSGSVDSSRYFLTFGASGDVQKHSVSSLITVITNGAVAVKDSIADVKSTIATAAAPPVVILSGGSAAFDGFGGIIKWDSAGTDADDPPRVIRLNDFSSSGVYRQIL